MSLTFLQSLDLSKSEIELYGQLLKLGEVPVATLLSKTKLKRPTLYNLLYTLESKGLVSHRDLKKKIHFKPEPPTKLLDLAQTKFQSINRTIDNIQSSLPMLGSLYVLSTEQPIVRTFEGVQGLIDIYEDCLQEKQKIYVVMQTEDMNPEILEYLVDRYNPKRTRLKIPTQVIAMSGLGARKMKQRDAKEFRTTLIVPAERFPFQHEICIYGDKVAYLHYKKNEPLIGILINHPTMAKTMKTFFDLSWEGALKYQHTR